MSYSQQRPNQLISITTESNKHNEDHNMFDRFGSKSTNYNDTRSRRNSSYSNIGRSTLDVPALVTPRPSVDSDYLPSYQSMSSSTGDARKERSQSTPDELSRGEASLINTSRPGSSAESKPARRRHRFWRTSLWNSKHDTLSGPRVRASSQSVSFPHPSVVEEQMRNMPHHDWRGRNRPDRVWDDENLGRLYW